MSETIAPSPEELETKILPPPEVLVPEAVDVAAPAAEAPIAPEAAVPTRTERVLGRLATIGRNTGRRMRESAKNRLENLEKGDEFYEALGSRAVEAAYTAPGTVPRTPVKPMSRTQRRLAERAGRKVQEHEHKAKQTQWREDYYRGTTYMSELDKKASKRAFKQARAALREDLQAGRIDMDTYTQKLTTLSKDTMVAKPDRAMRKLRKEMRDSSEKLDKKPYPTTVKVVRGVRKGINRAIAGSTELSTPVEPVDAEPTPSDLEPVLAEATASTPEPAESPLAKLRRLRAEGKLPDAKPTETSETAKPEAKATETEAKVEPAEEEASATFSEEVLANARKVRKQVKDSVRKDLQARKEAARGTLFDEAAVKAELEGEALQKAIAGVFGLSVEDFRAKMLGGDIDSSEVKDLTDAIEHLENEASKPKAPKAREVKAAPAAEPVAETEAPKDVKTVAKEIWDSVEEKARALVDAAKEADPDNFDAKAAWASARRQVKDEALSAVEPALRSGVRAAMRELDDAAYKARQAKREARASAPEPQPRRDETVQQRARRERQEKAAQKVAEGRRTFSHPDIPS